MKTTIVNLGPQHPAVHGVLRLILETNGETINKVTPEIGFLHRGTEKLCEYMEYYKILPFFSRFDYVATLSGEQLYSLALEKALKTEIPQYSRTLRTIFVELIRISNHLLAITAMAMDLGAITPFLWAFEEREEICQFFEIVSGARMHTALIRPGGVNAPLTHEGLTMLVELMNKIGIKLMEVNELLTNNRIFINRLKDVGIIKRNEVNRLGLSGPMARSVGDYKDLRKCKPYDNYTLSHLKSNFTEGGDCLSRYELRISEMYESMTIITQLIPTLLPYYSKHSNLTHKYNQLPIYNSMFKILASNKLNVSRTMEGVIHDFKMYSEGYAVGNYKSYISVDAPKGEYGVTLIGSDYHVNRPQRVKLRAPGFYHLQSFNTLATGELLSNLLTILGSIDVVMGEVDK